MVRTYSLAEDDRQVRAAKGSADSGQTHRREERGQALTEFALVLPLLLLLVGGIVEFGRVTHAYLTVQAAAREGARIAALGAPDYEIAQRVREAAPSLSAEALVVAVTPDEDERYRGDPVTVVASYDVDIVVPVIQQFLPDPFSVRASAVMRME